MKLTIAPENGWLEDDPASFWGKFGLFSGAFTAVSFKEGKRPKTGDVFFLIPKTLHESQPKKRSIYLYTTLMFF